MARAQILKGPLKWDLILALFDPEGNGSLRSVTFLIKVKSETGNSEVQMKVQVHIISVQRLGNSRYRIAGIFENSAYLTDCEGEYSSETGKGFLEYGKESNA